MSGFDYDETMKLVEKVIALQKEIEELRELIKQAKILLTQNTHKLSQEQWLSDVNKVDL